MKTWGATCSSYGSSYTKNLMLLLSAMATVFLMAFISQALAHPPPKLHTQPVILAESKLYNYPVRLSVEFWQAGSYYIFSSIILIAIF